MSIDQIKVKNRSPSNNGLNGGQDKHDEDEHDTTCGIGSWRPKWLQFFASPMFFLINLCLIGVIQGTTGTIFFSSMSTLEKRFAFGSRLSSIIMIADNFADMIVSIPQLLCLVN